uniref:ATP synthase F0 subunit 8 n=1 Tax=Cyanidiococcus yangmingshanensis TaxID=2690220 RepID=A0A7H0WBF6_9RHOD|nr:ATP synthase F0 subunit 8 [Cyanidiococcus yangmingshanensis]UNJ18946.1 ATP synthase F0 subunit 8 [Cyanidioschyzonaceae sp. 2 FvB-2021]
MPQLDRVIIFTQIFWLLIIILVAYSFIIMKILPNSFRIMKLRNNFSKSLFISMDKLNEEQIYQSKKIVELNHNYINLLKCMLLTQSMFYEKILIKYYKLFFGKITFNEKFFNYVVLMYLYKNLIQKKLIN